MLKKLYRKDGIIMVFNDNQTMDYCYFRMNNYKDDKDDKEDKDDKKLYHVKKGFTYPQPN